MGAVKFRQGMSINLGLPRNRPKMPSPSKLKMAGDVVAAKVGWLTAVVHAITKPFVKAVQNYRGRGSR